jgi:predicted phosphate transport protein (TIGR00153 family)
VRLIPRDEHFYDMFAQVAARLTSSTTLLGQLFAEPQNRDRLVGEIKAVEHEADNLTHDVIARLNKSFITPMDREDIYELATQLDNVIDLVDGTARRVVMFRITDSRESARRLSQVLVRAARALELATTNIKDMKTVIGRGREVKLLEEEGDAIYHEAVGELFSGGHDAIEVMKWKEVYDTLERAIDKCEDVANVLEGIALKNS